MNRIYRLCWNRALRQWVVASELARDRSASSTGTSCRRHRRILELSLLASALAMAGVAQAANGPSGGQVIAGSGSIQQAGLITTIQQNSPTLQLNWQSFNIGADETVNFVQPGRSAIAVNRVFSNNPSDIFGRLNANGQVWLINPNGVLFGQSAQVNVGGLVASTLDPGADSLTGNQHTFSGSGTGRVVNQGVIQAASGGYVALVGNQVSNQGVISARLGSVALAGGSAVTLTFDDVRLVRVQVDRSTLNNLAENHQLIVADGGQVVMTAGAKDSLLASVVNNTGKVRAQTVENHNGTITLLGGMTAGQVNVGGQLDASAPNGGSGGSIETSAAHFKLAPDAQISAAAPHGRAGTWLVDPTDLTIDSAAATTISTTLNGGTNVVEQTTANGASGAGVQSPGNGDITVAAPISWSNAAASLTLDAYNAINVNAAISGAGEINMFARAANLTIGSGASVVGGAGVTLVTAGNFINNGGASAVSTGTSAPWLIYSSNPTRNTTGGLTPSFIQYNAPYPDAPAGSGNGFLYSLAPTVTLTSLTGTVSKVYDGTTTAILTGANLQTSGLVNGDQVTRAIGTYATANAGTGLVVSSPTSIANVTFFDATGTIPVYGYKGTGQTSAAIGTITRAPLTASIVNDPTKVYDGTTSATLTSSNYSFSGFVAGQGATVNQASSVSYATPDAGSGIAMSASFTPTNFVANSGTSLSNYILPTTATGTGTIDQAPLLVSGLTTSDKVYDGTRTASLSTSGATLFGLISTDAGQVTLGTTGASAAFVSPNAGTNIQVIASGFTLSGGKAANYFLQPAGYLEADITLRPLTVTGVTANNKVYDGNTSATLNVGSAGISGLVASDEGNVTLSTTGSTGTFSQSNVGNNLAVSVNGFTLSGSAASNYSVSSLAGITANITPAPLTIDFQGSPTKIYDGTTAVALNQSNYTISGFVAGQGATITQVTGGYATQHAGTNIPVTATLTASDFSPDAGTSMSNYSFPASLTSATGIIQPQPIQVDIVNNPSKVYDGNDVATLGPGNYTVTGTIPGEQITLSPVPTTGTYASSNVGFWNVTTSLSTGNFTAGPNTLLSDYLLPTTATGMGTIYKAPIDGNFTVSITGNPSKVYDGNTIAIIAAGDFTLSGFAPGQGATVNQTVTGDYASKNAGSQPVHATMLESYFTPDPGTDLNNYSFPVDAYGTGTIIPAPLTATIINNPTKIYNGTADACVTCYQFQIDGFVTGEGATITPTTRFSYSSANAGHWTVSGSLVPSNFTADSGTLLTNYDLPTSAAGPGSILQAPLYIINAYANNKIYDTTTAATLNVASAALSGLVAGDEGNVTLNTSTTGTFAQSNVGNGIAVSASGFSISGSASANYLLQPISGLAANITPAPLTIIGADANDKVYDGTTTATINTSGASLSGVLGNDDVTLNVAGGTGNFITANVGNSLLVNSSGFTIGGAQAGNYSVSQPYGLTANITPRPLTVSITGNPIKAYDGTTSVSLAPSDYTISGLVSGQSATINGSTSSAYLSPNVGTNIGLTATLEPSNFTSPLGTNLSNYLLPTTATGPLGEITAAIITLTGTRVYDATTHADASVFSVNDLVNGVNGQTLGLSGVGTLSSKNVGVQVPLSSLGTLALSDGTGLASNYQLDVAANDWVTITKADLTVLNTVAHSKVYDGNRDAALTGATLNGVLLNDVVTLGNDTVGTFDTKNVGTNKPVATSMTISGTDAGNYNLIQPTGLVADITKLGVTVSVTGIDKMYDGTNAAQVNYLSIPDLIAGDNVSYTAGSSTFSQSDVGTNLPVTVTGIALTGADAGNYTLLNDSATTTANILARILNLTASRIYDTTNIANAALFGSSGVLNGVTVNGVTETLTLSGSGTVADKNIGNQKAMNVSGFTLTGTGGGAKATNYTLVGGTDWLTITPADLYVLNTVAASKVYDGNTNAALSGATLSGVLSGDTVTLGDDTLGQFDNKNVGNNKPVTTSMSIGGTDAGNYTLHQPTDLTANITPLIVTATVTATGNNKVYDGTTNATVNLSSSDVLSGDTVVFSYGSATFVTKNVGNGILINVADITESGADAGNYVFQNNTATATANITPYILKLTGTRVYDAGPDANANLFGNSGVLNGVTVDGTTETLALSGSGVLVSKNVGTEAFSSLGTLTLADGSGGGLATNYQLDAPANNAVTIKPYNLTVTGTTSVPKVYDATTNATLQGSALVGVFSGDTVTLGNDTSGTFDNKNVGTGKTVTPGTMTISGADAANYTLSQPSALTDGIITPLAITVDATAQNKVYDTTTTATANVSSTGVLTGDQLTLSYGTANFATPNVGNGIQVTVNGISGAGADLGNYTFNTTATTAANITPYILSLNGARTYDATVNADASVFGSITGLDGQTLSLSGSGTLVSKNVGKQALASLGTLALGNGTGLAANYQLAVPANDFVTINPLAITVQATGQDKVYDGNSNATVTLGSSGVLGGDVVNFAYGSALFNNPNVGNNKPVNVSGINATGTDAGNYTFNTTAVTSANITPYLLMLQGTRVYDGTANAAASLFGNNGVLTGVNGETITLSGTGTLASKNVSNAQPFATNGLAGYTLTGNNGALASNYTLGTGVGDWVAITRKALTVTAVGQDKVYDGTTAAQLSSFTVNGLVAGDSASLVYTNAAFTQANAGNNIPITVSGIGGSGSDINNYTFPSSVTTSANITAYILSLTGARVYNGTPYAAANLFGNNGVLTGVNGETLTLGGSGTLMDKNVGVQKPFAAGGLAGFTLTGNNGALASNYTLDGGIDWVTITPLAITLSVTAQDKVYDGTTAAQAALLTPSGLIAGDTVDFNFTAANFASKDVGNNKLVTVTGISDSGADAANYSFNNIATTTANITPFILDLTGRRIYDGTATANASLFGNQGVLTGADGETLTLSGSGTLVDKNVGQQKSFAPLGLNGFSLTGNNGALASNYTFAGGTDWVTITPKPILVTASVADKTYDGTTAATLLGLSNGGIIAGDDVTISYTSAEFVSPNAGDRVPIIVDGISLTGTDAGNYIYPSIVPTAADIFPFVLNLTGTRTYDGSNIAAASLFGTQGVLAGVHGETLTLGGSGTLSDKNVGFRKSFASNGLAGFTLTGNGSTLASNYTLTGGTDWVTITRLPINVGASASDKTYDGNTTATVSLGSNGVLAGDNVSFSDSSANFDSKDAGTGKQVTVDGISASGADAGNYTFNNTAVTQANINPVILNLTGTRVYDATTLASASLFGNSGVLTGVNGETLTLGGSGVLTDKNVGNQKAFAPNGLAGFTLTGNGNALASNYTLAGGFDWVTVTPATLTVTGTQTTDRPYDGTTLDSLSGATLAGILGSDDVVLGNDATGLFNDPNVGNDKPVNTSMTISGADAGNYVLVQPTGLTADITQPIGPPTPPLPNPFPFGFLAALQSPMAHNEIDTPYGTARDNATGAYTGNQKLEADHPLERNRIRSDFHPGLPLQVVDGGVRLPSNKSP
ncbi:YDG domain-containing protein [Dyella amyloliquefaciens]|uniref:YDG domain-containing protein n=1 Tax=Dyella amyloliquefaciens TaxID=1770545 RepID=UPI00102E6C0D|nr:YDG domain-containing protein [Dyella amyloliquefaciens]